MWMLWWAGGCTPASPSLSEETSDSLYDSAADTGDSEILEETDVFVEFHSLVNSGLQLPEDQAGFFATFGSVVGDLNQDGLPDIVAVTHLDQPDWVYLGDSLGLRTGDSIDLGTSPDDAMNNNTHAAVLADLDGRDGPDLVLGNNRKPNRVLLNQGGVGEAWMGLALQPEQVGGGVPEPCSNQEICGHATWAMAAGDVDLDGDVDLYVATADGEPDRVYLNQGDEQGVWGGFADAGLALGSGSTVAVVAVDGNGDGCVDFATGNQEIGQQGQDLVVWQNDCAGGFTEVLVENSGFTRALAAGDGNGDGLVDLVAVFGTNGVAEPSQAPRWFFGDGAGGFADGGTFGSASNAASVALADLEGDGDLDVVIGNRYSDLANQLGGESAIYLNQDGVFEAAQTLNNRDTRSVRVADFNGDDRLDVFEGNWGMAFPEGEADELWLGAD